MGDFFLFFGLIILGLSILVVIHEFGHFLPAKLFGTRVEKFYLFFDPWFSLFKFKKGGTEYGVGWLPLGGYVKISGMIDESMDKDFIEKPAEEWEFRSKSVWQRLIIMTGGVIMNVILGCIIFIALAFVYGELVMPIEKMKWGIEVPEGSLAEDINLKTGDKIISFKGEPVTSLNDVKNPGIFLEDDPWLEVERNGEKVRLDIPDDFISKLSDRENTRAYAIFADGPPKLEIYEVPDTSSIAAGAHRAGIKDGDLITMIDSTPVALFSEMRGIISKNANSTVAITVKRGSENLTFDAVQVDSNGKIYAGLDQTMFLDTIEYGFGGAIKKGIKDAFYTVWLNAMGMKKIFTGKVNAADSVSGPIEIAKMYGRTFKANGWRAFWRMTGMLSMILALMNILPIPALDGGHVVFLLIEAIMGREPPVKVRLYAQQVGMILLLALMAFILINDFLK